MKVLSGDNIKHLAIKSSKDINEALDITKGLASLESIKFEDIRPIWILKIVIPASSKLKTIIFEKINDNTCLDVQVDIKNYSGQKIYLLKNERKYKLMELKKETISISGFLHSVIYNK